MSIPFRTRGKILQTHTPVGSKFHNDYEIQISENGHKVLVKIGEHNEYEKIQEHLEETLIENILQRAELGDPLALEARKGSYLDTTQMPKTLAEAQNKILAIKQEFEQLPVNIRKEFDFSPEKYIQEYGSNGWAKAMGFIKEEPKKEEPKKEEPKGAEQ